MRRSLWWWVVVAAVSVGLVACGSDDGEGASSGSGSSGTTVPGSVSSGEETLFVVSATGGSLTDSTLTLTGVGESVTTFTDRPARSVGSQDVASFVSSWASEGFESDPPNAALVTVESGGHRTTVVELGVPTEADGELSFPVTVLSAGEVDGALASLAGVGGHEGELVDPSLFIDAGTSGSMVPLSIDGTWAPGASSVTFSNMAPAPLQLPLGARWEMQTEAPVQFTNAADGYGVLNGDALPLEADLVAFVLVDGATLDGSATLAEGSSLQLSVCGPSGPSTTSSGGPFSLSLSC